MKEDPQPERSITIRIPESDYRKIKMRAVQLDMTLKEYITQLALDEIEQQRLERSEK